ncbi:MAG: cytidylate kinase-like family protein [Acidimicrobiaceae bacterium]|nr:cytidylate kinase-like family protein [Acidimicrobiaceae bacterium]
MAARAYKPLVTMSASYGSGGSVIAPRLAERLRLPFIDRAISVELSEDAAAAVDQPSQEHLTEGEEAATPGNRLLAYFARAASIGAMLAPDPVVDADEVLRERSESALAEVAVGEAGLVLGHAAAVVLARRPNAFHIRLDGPVERRIEWAARYFHQDVGRCRERQQRTDRARVLFVKRLYRADPESPRWYQLVLDSTVFSVEVSIDILANAAERYFAALTATPE